MKKASTKKRVIAYSIDIFILCVFLGMSAMMTKVTENEKVLRLELSEINEKAVSHDIGITNYLFHFSEIQQDLDKENIVSGMINLIFILIYFVLIPYFMEGKTFGKYMMKIRVVSMDESEASLKSLFLRNVILNGLLYSILSLLFIYLIPGMTYFFMITILGIIQFTLVILSAFMVLYRKDGIGLHEKISHTKVIEV